MRNTCGNSRFLTRRQVLSLPLLSPLLAPADAPAGGRSLAVKKVTVIDGTGAVQQDRTVVIKADRIIAVGEASRVPVPRDAQVVDARGKFLIGGLWDMHVHLSWTKASALPALLANGVTGVRDMGGLLCEIDEWRTQILAGEIRGPHIVRAGPTVNGRVFAFHQIAVTAEPEARATVRALQKAGVDLDFIKVHAAISREAYFVVADECKKLYLPFAGPPRRESGRSVRRGAGQPWSTQTHCSTPSMASIDYAGGSYDRGDLDAPGRQPGAPQQDQDGSAQGAL